MTDREQLDSDLHTLVEAGIVVAVLDDQAVLRYIHAELATDEDRAHAVAGDLLERLQRAERRVEDRTA